MADIRDFALPDLGEGLEDAEIVEWLVEVGDHVELNQPVCEVETAKAVVVVPSPFAGRVVERVGDLGEVLEVGAVLLRVDVSDGEVDPRVLEDAAALEGDVSEGAPQDTDAPQPLVGYGEGRAGGRDRRERHGALGGRARAKPPVRKLAKDLGVDLDALVPGSGPQGTVTREDVRAAAGGDGEAAGAGRGPEQPRAPEPPTTAVGGPAGFRGRAPGDVEEIRGIRRRIVERMEASRREIPEATASRDADVTRLWELRRRLGRRAGEEGLEVRITPLALVMRAVVVALRRFPTLNARLDREAGRIELLEPIHLGVAVDTARGLVVPVVEDAHLRSVAELARATAELAERAREGTLTPAELTGGTFTVNNYGVFGNDTGDPIINHPEVALLGVGAMRQRPWVVDGELAVRRVCTLTVAFDHRVCDGGEAGRFVTYVADLCEDPAGILLHA